MRFGAQRYELKRSIASLRELLRMFQTRQSHIRSIPDKQRLDCPAPHTQTTRLLPPTHTHTTPQYSIKLRFLTYISPGKDSIKREI